MQGMYEGSKILIVGGTGTIGQHLTRALLQYNPAVIRIFSRDEHKQFEMQQELGAHKNMRFLIGDVRDAERLTRAMEDIDYVFHLAAMKHVPACEYNPFEAVQTNVIGTQNVITAAIHAGVKKVLFTSSDKSISPTNTYGATKLMAERLISAADYQKGPKSTIFASVRFGNIMGARGSVIPLFNKQIMEQRKVTLTSREMQRYMMTPRQAITLLLKANQMSRGGEVFVLKMPIVRLEDLTHIIVDHLSEKHGIQGEVAVEEVGLRPGEKMEEELMTVDEKDKVIELAYMYIIPPIYGHSDATYVDQDAVLFYNDLHYIANEIISMDKLSLWLINEKLI